MTAQRAHYWFWRDATSAFVCAVAYFVVPAFVVTMCTFGAVFWTTFGYLGSVAFASGLGIAMPVWLVARLLVARNSHTWVTVLVFSVAGAVATYLALGVVDLTYAGRFDPLNALGATSRNAMIVIIAYAALCSGLGWLTARAQSSAVVYEDALDGLSFTELVELARRADR